MELGYLYVDSSNEMMDLVDPTWKILGTSVQLPQASQLLTSEANLAARLGNIDNYPGIKPWIGDRAQWREILNSIIGVVLGGPMTSVECISRQTSGTTVLPMRYRCSGRSRSRPIVGVDIE